MVRGYDRVSVALGIIVAGFLLVALFLRPQPLPPGSAQYRSTATLPIVVDRPPTPGLTYALDVIETNGQAQPAGNPLPISTTGAITVHGWALDSRTNAPGRQLLVSIDRSRPTPVTTYGAARPDVAAAIGQSALNSGFAAVIPAGRLRPGRHVLRFTIVGNDGQTAVFPTVVEFELVSGPGK
jgi:hypothetical protein